MRLKPFKKEKFTNKKRISIIIMASLATIFLFIAIYQSFAVYNFKLSERIIDAKVGSLYDIRTLAIYIDGEPQPDLTDFPKDKDFDKVECFANGEPLNEDDIKGVWDFENNALSIKGFAQRSECNIHFITPRVVTITFNANGANLGSGVNVNVTRNCTIIKPATTCTVTPPTITRAGWTIHGFSTTNQASWTNPASTSVSANATHHAITSRTVTLTNLIVNGSFESGWPGGWEQGWGWSPPPLETSGCSHGSRCIRFDANQNGGIVRGLPTLRPTANHHYYSSAMFRSTTNLNPSNIVELQWYTGWGATEIMRFTPNAQQSSTTWRRITSSINRIVNPSPNNWTFRAYMNENNRNDTVWLDALMLINLTSSFGADNEPTVNWMNANINNFAAVNSQNYFEGTSPRSVTVWNRTHM